MLLKNSSRCVCAPPEKRGVPEQDPEELRALADFFKLFGDPTRLRLLEAMGPGELCVCHLAEILEMTVSAVSHQLAALRKARLVRSRKEGKAVYYALDDDHVGEIIHMARTHLKERKR